MSEMPISEVCEHIGELVGRARYSHEPTILTHYGSPAAVVISFEEYQRLRHAAEEVHAVEAEEVHVVGEAPEYRLPPEIQTRIEESRRHPERLVPRPERR